MRKCSLFRANECIFSLFVAVSLKLMPIFSSWTAKGVKQNLYVNFLSHSLNCLYTFKSYLSEKGLVHRDLAARNILVGHGKKLKIGDFGLMREMYHELYEVKKQRKLPIKWMAPEAIYEQIFTSKSDVYVLFLTYNTAEPITPILRVQETLKFR